MRLCPSVEGSATPLITHRIGVEVCMARQGTFFHKCHRCIYRGRAADWEPEEAQLVVLDVHAAEVAAPFREPVPLPRPAAVRRPARTASRSANGTANGTANGAVAPAAKGRRAPKAAAKSATA